MSDQIEKAADTYNVYQVLNSDTPVEVGVESIFVTVSTNNPHNYYFKLTTDSSDSIPLYLRVPIEEHPPSKDMTFFSKINGDEERTNLDSMRMGKFSINPQIGDNIDPDKSKIEAVPVQAGGVNFHFDLFTEKPKNAKQVEPEQIEQLLQDVHISEWYYTNKRDDEQAVETKIHFDVDADKNDGDEITCTIPLGEATTTITLPIPPYGDNPEVVDEFIQQCGGDVTMIDGADVILQPTEHSDRMLTTDDGMFTVTYSGKIEEEKEREKQRKKKEIRDIGMAGIGVVIFFGVIKMITDYIMAVTTIPTPFYIVVAISVAIMIMGLFVEAHKHIRWMMDVM